MARIKGIVWIFILFIISCNQKEAQKRRGPHVFGQPQVLDSVPITRLAYKNADYIFGYSMFDGWSNQNKKIVFYPYQAAQAALLMPRQQDIFGYEVYAPLYKIPPVSWRVDFTRDGKNWQFLEEQKNVNFSGSVFPKQFACVAKGIAGLRFSVSPFTFSAFPFFKIKLNGKPIDDKWQQWLAGSPAPKFIVEDGQKQNTGWQKLVWNNEAYLAACTKMCLQNLYASPAALPADKQKLAVKIIFGVNPHGSGIASVAYGNGQPVVYINKYYFTKMNMLQASQELPAVLVHELTHIYQYGNLNSNNNNVAAAMEGLADAVRLKAGYCPIEYRKPGGSWLDGYRNTAFFLDWLSYKNKNALIVFNESLKNANYDNWQFDDGIAAVTGRKNNTLAMWNAYQAWLKSLPGN